MMQAPLRFCPVCATSLVEREDAEEAGRLRLACPDGHWTFWDNPLPVLAALVEYEGRILLARNAAWPEKMFALITGFMERGETPEQGVARELREETSLQADEVKLIGVYEFMRKNELIIAYHVKASGEIRLSPELVDFRLVAPEKLRPWPSGTGHAMADWMRSRGLPFEYADLPRPVVTDPAA
ncbi:NUDIX domain-containing protein [Lacisediminimonas profundi]|uniref:NUDIX domain-containing protein n=1 Tax=Lacisediminimonas profundi TaxID=2603856 RepID=UPI0018839838|nr:NUDIX domain-containing protein [Lacisediminimonas profundi]